MAKYSNHLTVPTYRYIRFNSFELLPCRRYLTSNTTADSFNREKNCNTIL